MVATKIYFLSTGNTDARFARTTSFDGRHPKCASAVGGHGATGGSLTHANTPTFLSESGADNVATRRIGGYEPHMEADHNSHPASGMSVDPADNNPLSITLELIWMYLSEWEASVRGLPANAVVLSESALTWNEVARYTGLDGRIVKLGNAGVQAGQALQKHVVRCALGNITTPPNGYQGVAGNPVCPRDTHGHSEGTNDSDEKTTMPYHVVTRLYKANSATAKALAGMIAFVDGPTSANWDALSDSRWIGAYIMGGDQDAGFTGSNTHDHADVTIESGTTGSPGSLVDNDEGGNALDAVIGPHKHQIYLRLASANHEPMNVQLYPVKLNTTLYAPSLRISACLF